MAMTDAQLWDAYRDVRALLDNAYRIRYARQVGYLTRQMDGMVYEARARRMRLLGPRPPDGIKTPIGGHAAPLVLPELPRRAGPLGLGVMPNLGISKKVGDAIDRQLNDTVEGYAAGPDPEDY